MKLLGTLLTLILLVWSCNTQKSANDPLLVGDSGKVQADVVLGEIVDSKVKVLVPEKNLIGFIRGNYSVRNPGDLDFSKSYARKADGEKIKIEIQKLTFEVPEFEEDDAYYLIGSFYDLTESKPVFVRIRLQEKNNKIYAVQNNQMKTIGFSYVDCVGDKKSPDVIIVDQNYLVQKSDNCEIHSINL